MHRLRVLCALLLLPLGLAVGSCGVAFESDDFCYKCSTHEDCGEGYECKDQSGTRFCVPKDDAAKASSPCYAG